MYHCIKHTIKFLNFPLDNLSYFLALKLCLTKNCYLQLLFINNKKIILSFCGQVSYVFPILVLEVNIQVPQMFIL